MARSEYEGAPRVEARTQSADDYLRVNASPNAFGGALAAGGEELGAGVSQLAAFYGKAAADDATNNTLQQVTNILRGDPHKTVVGPDGQPAPDTGFFGLQGANAMSARESTANAIDNVIRQNRNNLQTPQAQLEYDTETRRWRAQWTAQMGEHADNSQRVWMKSVNSTKLETSVNQGAANPLDPNTVALARDGARSATVQQAHIDGTDPDEAVLRADRLVDAARIRALIPSDPLAAVKLSRDVRPTFAGTTEGLELNRQATGAAAQQLQGMYGNPNNMERFGFGQGGEALQGSVSPGSDALHKAFLGQESGGNPNVGESVDHAKGIGQLTQGFFDRFAKPGERIDDPVDNARISARGLDHFAQEYGGDPARIAVAYFSGEGNVAPAGSATPWKHDRADGNGTHVSAYVAGIQKRLGATGGGDLTTGGTDTESRYLDFVRGKATEVFPDEPGIVEHVVRGVQSDLQSNFAIGAASARTGVTSDIQNALAEVDRGQTVTGHLPTEAEVRAAYPRDPEKVAETLQGLEDIKQVSSLLVGLVDKTPAQVQQLIESVKPDPDHPETFARRAAIAAHVDAALSARAKAIATDPGNYVIMTHPDVAALLAKVTMPGGHIEDYGALDTAVRSHLTAMGVAEEDIRILPKPIATAMVRQMEQDPEKAPAMLAGMEEKLGTHWGQFSRDLVQQGGMSPDYQVIAELMPDKYGNKGDPSSASLLARAYAEPGKNNGKKIDDSLAPPTITSVRKFVDADPKLKQLEDSVVASSGSKAMRDSIHNAVQTLTFARMIYKGEAQDVAQAAAVKAFTNDWEFMRNGGGRVPRDRYDDVNYNAQYTLQNWASTANVARPQGVDGAGQPTFDNYIAALKALPTWVTAPNGDALWLKDSQGKIVRQAKDGQPVSVWFKYRKIQEPATAPSSLTYAGPR